jgi:hypothetical protein
MAAVDRLSKLADMLIWVLDPQKYADASVHNRYLIPLAGHASVFTVVLNQIDLLPEDQVKDCEQDLRRLLDAEGLHDTPVLALSARTGDGLDELRALLTETVSANHAASERISADIDSVISGFAAHAGAQVAPDAALAAAAAHHLAAAPVPENAEQAPPRPSAPPWELPEDEQPEAVPQRPPWEDATPDGAARERDDPVANVPEAPAAELIAAFARAAGLTAVAESLASAREALAARFTSWPVARLARGRRDPVKSLRAGQAGGPVAGQAQQSEVDNAITALADSVSGGLPDPWPASLRDAARSNAPKVPSALAAAVAEAVPAGESARVPVWWRLITGWQWLLTALAVVGVVWAIVITVGHGGKERSTLLGDVSLIPWLLIMAAAVLLLGFLTASGCQNMAVVAAERERERAERAMGEQVAGVARDLVLAPLGQEIAQYERYRHDLAVAAGLHGV